MYINKLAIIVKGNPKAPFSIATTPRCREMRYTFLYIVSLTFNQYLIILSVKQRGIEYRFF